jgi:hypothetical protein
MNAIHRENTPSPRLKPAGAAASHRVAAAAAAEAVAPPTGAPAVLQPWREAPSEQSQDPDFAAPSPAPPPASASAGGAPDLLARLAAQEAQSGRQVTYIHSMHAWAGKTAAMLREMQARCEAAEAAAEAAHRESAALRQRMDQLQGQQEANNELFQEVEAQVAGLARRTGGNNPGGGGAKRRRGNPDTAPAHTGRSLNGATDDNMGAAEANRDNNQAHSRATSAST